MMLASVPEDIFRAILQGGPPGTVYALVALGFVLAYKTSGVFNLAFGAQAYASAVLYFKAHDAWGWPIIPAFVLAVLIMAPALGFLLEWAVFRHLRTAPPVARLVVTIGLSVAIPAIVDILLDFQPKGGKTPDGIIPKGDSVFYDPFGVYAYSRNELMAMGVAVVAMLGLAALFKFSAIGLRMRAVVESPRMTELNGIPADRVSAAAWALSSLFAGLAGVLIAPRFSTLTDDEFFNIVVIAIAAAAIGLLVSLPRALVGGLGLGAVIALSTTFLQKWSKDLDWLKPIQNNFTPAIPFLVLFAILVFVPSVRRARAVADPLSGVDPPPSSTNRAASDPRADLIRRLVVAGVAVAIAVVVFTRADTAWLFLVTQAVLLAVVFLSITVMTGLGGHISLCQGAFAAIGGFTVFQLVDRYDLSVLVAAVIGAAIAAVVGALLSLPIRRLSGIWVAIATLAFAFFFDAVMVKFSWVGSARGSASEPLKVPRPVIGPWDLIDDKAFLVLAVIILAVASVAVSLFARSYTGQRLRALRGSEVASESIGISPARSRVIVFAVSAFIAGLGGALMSIHQKNVNYGLNFAPFAALFWLVLVVSFGSRSTAGAIGAAASFALFGPLILEGNVLGWILRSPERVPDWLTFSSKWRLILFGLGTIQYAKHPEGVIEMSKARAAEKRERRAARRLARNAPAAGTELAEVTEPVR